MGGSRRRGGAEPPGTGSAAVDPEPDPEQVARSIALRLLTMAPRSRSRLAEAMARKDVPEDVAERVLDRFVDVGLIDDAAYARQLVHAKHDSRALARRALAVELRRAGVGEDDAREALSEIGDAQEEAAAHALLERRWRTDADPAVQGRRMLAMLGRKGYPAEVAARLVRAKVRQSQAQMRDDEAITLETDLE